MPRQLLKRVELTMNTDIFFVLKRNGKKYFERFMHSKWNRGQPLILNFLFEKKARRANDIYLHKTFCARACVVPSAEGIELSAIR